MHPTSGSLWKDASAVSAGGVCYCGRHRRCRWRSYHNLAHSRRPVCHALVHNALVPHMQPWQTRESEAALGFRAE